MLTTAERTPDASDILAAWPDAMARLEDMSLDQVEALLIRRAMTRFEGNVSKAAKTLGLSRSSLYRRLQRHGI